MVVYEKVIAKHVNDELPFMATENIIMECVKKGGDRQELHEKIRTHSMEAAHRVKSEGLNNDLLDRIANDSFFNLTKEEILSSVDPNKFIGRAPSQVIDFVEEVVKPILKDNEKLLGLQADIQV
ncbi:hypothetical protein SDC9_184187 [bioreactor metagenome]|uniref:Adenylosuccinate lyase n=2 Tax=root TaxID=1 RepID=A0A645HCB8_9ZZZZ